MTPNHVGIPIPFTNMAWNYDNLMHGLICPVTISLGQVQPFGPRGGELFEAVLSQGVGGRENKKIFSLWFCEVRVISRAVCSRAADLKTAYFQGKMQEFVGEWLKRNNLFIIIIIIFNCKVLTYNTYLWYLRYSQNYTLYLFTVWDTYATNNTILYLQYKKLAILTYNVILTLLTVLYSTLYIYTKKNRYLYCLHYGLHTLQKQKKKRGAGKCGKF